MQLLLPVIDQTTGQMTAPPLQMPIPLDVTQYDVVIQEKSMSDFKKAQAFNAAIALHQSGFVMDGEYMIMHAPIDNPEEALESHKRARRDIINQLMGQLQMMQEQMDGMNKQSVQNKSKKVQPANAQRGKMQSQAGQQSMIGGQLMAGGRTT